MVDNVMDLSHLNEKEPESAEDLVHDIIGNSEGGVIAVGCPAADCSKAYMVAFVLGEATDWIPCPHCQMSRIMVTDTGELLIEKDTGVLQ